MSNVKYKIKYNNFSNIQEAGALLSCVDYYNDNNYCFKSFNDLKNFLIDMSGKNNNWNNSTNIQSNYNGTILDELIKINFDMTRYEELPELIKLLLNIKPKPAHLLEFLLTKENSDYVKSILTNTYEGSYVSSGYAITKAINNLIDKKVIFSIQEILDILPEGTDLSRTNTWDSLTKLLEFVSCLLDSSLLNAYPTALDSIKKSLKEQLVQIVFLDDLLYNPRKRIFKNLYPKDATRNCGEISNAYRNYVLKDFFNTSLNTNFVLPPSVLLLISIKLNPIINIKDNYYNDLFRSILQYTRYECNYSPPSNITSQIENYVKEPQLNELKEEDSNLIDIALVPVINSDDMVNTTRQTNYSLLNKFGSKYTELLNNIKVNFTINKSLSNVMKNFNLFQNKNKDTRIIELTNKVNTLNNKKTDLNNKLSTAKTTKTFGLFKSEKEKIEEEIKKTTTKIRQYEIEIALLRGVPNATRDEKINLILSNILLLIGLGLDNLDKDICSIDNKNSNISWRTFDKTLKILDSNLFKTISFVSSKTLTHLLLQYVTVYTVYFPFDIRQYFYQKLKLNTPEKINKFNYLYDQYEKKIYEDFIHSDGFYYTEPDINGNINVYALFPSAKLLNEIKDYLITY